MNLHALSQVKYLRYFEVLDALETYPQDVTPPQLPENSFEEHVLLDETQVQDLLKDAPKQFKARFDGYAKLDPYHVEKSNAVEEIALNNLFSIILCEPYFDAAKQAYPSALKGCQCMVNDRRVIEIFLRQKLNEDTHKYINAFAITCEMRRLIENCSKFQLTARAQ